MNSRIRIALLLFFVAIGLNLPAQNRRLWVPNFTGTGIGIMDTLGNIVRPAGPEKEILQTQHYPLAVLARLDTTMIAITPNGKEIGIFWRVEKLSETRWAAYNRRKIGAEWHIDAYFLSLEGDTLIHLPNGQFQKPSYKASIYPASVNLKWAMRKNGHGTQGGKSGYLTEEGKWLVEPTATYVSDFLENGWALMAVNTNYFTVDFSGKTFALDLPGQSAPKLRHYGLEQIYDGKKALYSFTGERVLGPGYREVQQLGNDFLAVKYGKQWDIISLNENQQPNLSWDNIKPLGKHLYIVEALGKKGLFHSESGKLVQPPNYANFLPAWDKRVDNTSKMRYIATLPDQSVGLLDENGEMIGEPEYTQISLFYKGVAAVWKGDKMAFIDENGALLTGFDYSGNFHTQHTYGDYLLARQNGKQVILDRKGNIILPPTYESVNYYHPKAFFVSEKGKFGLISSKNEEILPIQFDKIPPNQTEFPVWVQKEEKWGLANEKGEIKWINMKVGRVHPTQNGYAALTLETSIPRIDPSVIYFSKNGSMIGNENYPRIAHATRDLFWVTTPGGVGLINDQGKEILPPLFRNPKYGFVNGYALLYYLNGDIAGYVNDRGVVFFTPRK